MKKVPKVKIKKKTLSTYFWARVHVIEIKSLKKRLVCVSRGVTNNIFLSDSEYQLPCSHGLKGFLFIHCRYQSWWVVNRFVLFCLILCFVSDTFHLPAAMSIDVWYDGINWLYLIHNNCNAIFIVLSTLPCIN